MTEPLVDDVEAVTQEIAAKLGETDHGPVRQVRMIVQHAGVEFAREVMKETQDIEAGGGMLTADSLRRRTPGGVYFYVAKGKMDPALRQIIFPGYGQAVKGFTLDWDNRHEMVKAAINGPDHGILTMAPRITLQGRSRAVQKNENSYILLFEHALEPVAYARGIPTPPTEPTLYVVYMGKGQYDRVEKTLRKNPKDSILIEGACILDPELGTVSVFALTVSTRFIEKKQRQDMKNPAISGNDDETTAILPGKPHVMPNPRKERQNQRQQYENIKQARANAANRAAKAEKSPAPAVEKPKPQRAVAAPPKPTAPQPAASGGASSVQLKELELAAATLRERIATMEARKQPGVAMTKKILENTERQIEALRKEG